jgi:adenylate kinase
MRLVMLGAPGAGKGTQAVRLASEFAIPQISTGDILREAREAQTEWGKQAESYMKSGQLVPDQIVLGIIADRLHQSDCCRGYILDGFPRSVPQAEALDRILREQGEALTAVVSLEVAEDELIKRLLERKREDDSEEVIRQRLLVYKQQTEPLVDYYRAHDLLIEIDGMGSMDEIFDRILSALPNELMTYRVVSG